VNVVILELGNWDKFDPIIQLILLSVIPLGCLIKSYMNLDHNPELALRLPTQWCLCFPDRGCCRLRCCCCRCRCRCRSLRCRRSTLRRSCRTLRKRSARGLGPSSGRRNWSAGRSGGREEMDNRKIVSSSFCRTSFSDTNLMLHVSFVETQTNSMFYIKKLYYINFWYLK